MTKTVRSKKSVAEITEKLVSWARTWPTYQHIESKDQELTLAQKSIYFSFTLETHPPQESPHAKACPKGTFGSYLKCWNRQWSDEGREEIPCSEEQQEHCESFSERTTISGRIEDRAYGQPAVAAIMLNIDGKPTDEASRQRMEKEINGVRTFFKQFFGEDIIIVTARKLKIPIVDISQIARLDTTPPTPPTPVVVTPTTRTEQDGGLDWLRQKAQEKPNPNNLRPGSVDLYRIGGRVYAHGDFAHCPREDILHNFRVLRQILLEQKLVSIAKDYDYELRPHRTPMTPEEWERIQSQVQRIYHTQLIDITDESAIEEQGQPENAFCAFCQACGAKLQNSAKAEATSLLLCPQCVEEAKKQSLQTTLDKGAEQGKKENGQSKKVD